MTEASDDPSVVTHSTRGDTSAASSAQGSGQASLPNSHPTLDQGSDAVEPSTPPLIPHPPSSPEDGSTAPVHPASIPSAVIESTVASALPSKPHTMAHANGTARSPSALLPAPFASQSPARASHTASSTQQSTAVAAALGVIKGTHAVVQRA